MAKITKQYLNDWINKSLDVIISKLNDRYDPQIEAIDKQLEESLAQHPLGIANEEIRIAMENYAKALTDIFGDKVSVGTILNNYSFKELVKSAMHGNFVVEIDDDVVPNMLFPELMSQGVKLANENDKQLAIAMESAQKLQAIVKKAKKPEDALESLKELGFDVPMPTEELALQSVGEFKNFKDMLYGEEN